MAAYEDQQDVVGLFEVHLDRTSGDKDDPEEALRGDIVSARIVCVDNAELTNNNGVDCVFLLDTSGSMLESIKQLQASTLAYRDVLINEVGEDPEDEEKKELLEMKKETKLLKFGFDLVEFETNASLLYSTRGKRENNFTTTVRKHVTAKGSTNLQGGLELAFEQMRGDKPVVLCVLTDGSPNIGFQQADKLGTLVKELKGKRIVDVMAIGFGSGINQDVLKAIGEFSHIKSDSEIPVVFGNVALRVLSAFAFQTRVQVFTQDGREIDISDRVVVGTQDVNTLFSGRTTSLSFRAGDLPQGCILRLHYYDVAMRGFVERDYQIIDVAGREHPMKLITSFYEAEKDRMLQDLCGAQCGERDRAAIFLHKVSTWDRTAAVDARKEVEEKCNAVLEGKMSDTMRFKITSETRQNVTGCYTTTVTSNSAFRAVTSSRTRTETYHPGYTGRAVTSAPSGYQNPPARSSDVTPDPHAADRVRPTIRVSQPTPATVQSWSAWAASLVWGSTE